MKQLLYPSAKRLCHETLGYARDVFAGRSRQIDFVMLSGGRRGSHLLIDLINSHSAVHCDSELLHPGRVRERLPFLWSYLRGHSRQGLTYGFKLSLNQLRRQTDSAKFLAEFQQSGGRIIYLRRSDLFRASVSAMIAHKRGQYHDRSANPLQGMTFHLEVDHLLERLQKRKATDNEEAAILNTVPHLPIDYETDLLDASQQQATANRVFESLGVELRAVQTDMQRTSPAELSTVVENYDEILAAVRQSGLSDLISNHAADTAAA